MPSAKPSSGRAACVRTELLTALVCAVDGAVVSALVDDGGSAARHRPRHPGRRHRRAGAVRSARRPRLSRPRRGYQCGMEVSALARHRTGPFGCARLHQDRLAVCAGCGGPMTPIGSAGRQARRGHRRDVRYRRRPWRSPSPSSARPCTCWAASAGQGEARRRARFAARSPARCRSTRSAMSSDLDAVRAWTDDLSDRVARAARTGAQRRRRCRPSGPRRRRVTRSQLAAHVLGPHLMTQRLLPLLHGGRGRLGGVGVVGRDVPRAVGGRRHGVPLRIQRRPRLCPHQTDAGGAGRCLGAAAGRQRRPSREHAPGLGGDTRASPSTCRCSGRSPGHCCATRPTAPTPRCGWWRPVQSREPGHFWHDRAQRPTTFGWQRPEDRATVAALPRPGSAR